MGAAERSPGPSREWIASRGQPMDCPYCGSPHTERAAVFGPFHMSETYLCRKCGSPFSRIKWGADDDPEGGGPASPEGGPSGGGPEPSRG
jgi:DNA-directed RNA polymerase subunit RPC12/RpoP